LAKTIMITGSSTGLGLGAARAFAKRGYRVIATVRSEDDARRVQAEGNGNIHPVICDVTRKEHVAELPDCVREITGDGILDGLINNAGIMLAPGPIEFQKMENIHAQFDVNVFGMMAVTIALLPLLGTADTARKHAVQSKERSQVLLFPPMRQPNMRLRVFPIVCAVNSVCLVSR
jgi:NAD(P)-dependent dehydrogenase (short-subunit alcohol dehydrogenase family)